MHWTPRRFAAAIALIVVPFLTPCSGPAQPTAEDRAAITRLAAHLRQKEGFADHQTATRWLIASSGAAARGRDYGHAPAIQIGGVTAAAEQDRILAEIRKWPDHTRFKSVEVYFYGKPASADNPFSALQNLLRSEQPILDAALPEKRPEP